MLSSEYPAISFAAERLSATIQDRLIAVAMSVAFGPALNCLASNTILKIDIPTGMTRCAPPPTTTTAAMAPATTDALDRFCNNNQAMNGSNINV